MVYNTKTLRRIGASGFPLHAPSRRLSIEATSPTPAPSRRTSADCSSLLAQLRCPKRHASQDVRRAEPEIRTCYSLLTVAVVRLGNPSAYELGPGWTRTTAEAALLEDGSKQEHLWGINLYLGEPRDDWIEFDSMINVRPSQGNRSRDVEEPKIRDAIRRIVEELIE